MKNTNEYPDDSEVRDCARLLENLEQEIQTAVGAISRNALSEFELSLWRQEMLCGRLKRSVASADFSAIGGYSRDVLQKCVSDLKTESERYDKVVARCARSVRALQDLCRLYRAASTRSSATDMLPFSCEV